MQEDHREFIARLSNRLHSLNDIAEFIRSENMKTSARHQFRRTVRRITPGAVSAEVEVDIGAVQPSIAIITNTSATDLALKRTTGVRSPQI